MKKLAMIAMVLALWLGTSAFTFGDAVNRVRQVKDFILAPVHQVIDGTLSIVDTTTASAGTLVNDVASKTKRYALDITARVL